MYTAEDNGDMVSPAAWEVLRFVRSNRAKKVGLRERREEKAHPSHTQITHVPKVPRGTTNKKHGFCNSASLWRGGHCSSK